MKAKYNRKPNVVKNNAASRLYNQTTLLVELC